MSFQVNPTPGAYKSLTKLNGANNLLSIALNRMPSGLRVDRPREERADSDITESCKLHGAGVRKRLAAKYDATVAEDSDKIVASDGGMARMGGLAETPAAQQAINPELAGNRLAEAKRQIVQNPVNALGAQANQSPDFVMKLLE